MIKIPLLPNYRGFTVLIKFKNTGIFEYPYLFFGQFFDPTGKFAMQILSLLFCVIFTFRPGPILKVVILKLDKYCSQLQLPVTTALTPPVFT